MRCMGTKIYPDLWSELAMSLKENSMDIEQMMILTSRLTRIPFKQESIEMFESNDRQ